MRRMWTVSCAVLMLLFVPIYLWQVQGWWTGGTGISDVPQPVFDASKAKPPFDPLDIRDFERGIIAGAMISDEIALYALTDPVELLRMSLVKYHESVQSYTCTLCKHERINGKLNPPDVIECWFTEQPFSVLMHWKEGGGPASASLYVAGEHDNKMCVRPKLSLIPNVYRPPDAAEVKATTRYLITEFGLRCGSERTYKAWKDLRDKGVTLQVRYLGLQTHVEEAGGRPCHVIKRLCDPPEEEGMTEVTIYIDADSWLQVGSVLKANNDLIGSYWFKDIQINPHMDDKQFKVETLKKY